MFERDGVQDSERCSFSPYPTPVYKHVLSSYKHVAELAVVFGPGSSDPDYVFSCQRTALHKSCWIKGKNCQKSSRSARPTANQSPIKMYFKVRKNYIDSRGDVSLIKQCGLSAAAIGRVKAKSTYVVNLT